VSLLEDLAPRPRLLPVHRRAGYDWYELLEADRAEGTGLVVRLLEELDDEEARDEGAGLWAFVVSGRALAAAGVRREPCRDLMYAARVVGIYVHPDHRGRGYGQRLFARILRHARGRFRRLTARAEGEDAAGFLEHHGFVPFEHPCVSHFRLVGKR